MIAVTVPGVAGVVAAVAALFVWLLLVDDELL